MFGALWRSEPRKRPRTTQAYVAAVFGQPFAAEFQKEKHVTY
jgi:hypothetical protein